jgi:Na+-translocating ferredoxin:NAD+ oxidoreductase RnfD subunit
MRRYLAAALFAAIPCLGAAAYYFGAHVPAMLIAALAGSAAVEIGFAWVRRKTMKGGTVTFAVLFVLTLPPTTPVWMVVLGSAFGTLFGKEIFGGTGHHVFSPVLVGKSFLMFSYPTVVKGYYFGSMGGFEQVEAWTIASTLILVGAVAMIIGRPSNWRILGGIFIGGAGLGLWLQHAGRMPFETPLQLLAADGFLLGACFLACDPATSPRTEAGKWVYGLLIGLAAVMMRCFSTYSEGMLSAILVGNLSAPMIDACVRAIGRKRSQK